MRNFHLLRKEDESGVSGTGKVAEGVEFADGQCALHWLSARSSIAIYKTLDDLVAIHGHCGKTVVVFEPSENR